MNDFQHKIMTCLFVLVCSITNTAMADTFYQQQVQKEKISDKALQEALKQVKEHKDIEVIDKLSVSPFHQRNKAKDTTKKPFCLTCHQSLPHSKNERSRTFMNMHSSYIACETCHLRPKDIQFEYRWLAYDGIDAGREVAARNVITDAQLNSKPNNAEEQSKQHRAKLKQALPLAPQHGAKIAPYYEGVPAILFKQSEFANKTKHDWKQGSDTEQAKLKARLHAPLEKKGPECRQCHADEKPLLNLEALGASPQRLKQFQQNTIVRFFTRFKKDDQHIRINELLR